MEWLIWLIMSVSFVFIGLSVHVFKWYFLIAGYNTMSKEEKANVDIESVARIMGYWGYFNGVLFLIVTLLSALGVEFAPMVGLIIFGGSTVFLLIFLQRYDHNPKGKGGLMSKRRKGQQFGSIGFTIIILVAVGLLMVYFVQPLKVTIDDVGVRIHGIYGKTYEWDQIANAELLDELPGISRRTNGSSIGPYLRGHFRTVDSEALRLFVNRRQPPFIRIDSEEDTVIFNLKTPEETRAAAEEIFRRL